MNNIFKITLIAGLILYLPLQSMAWGMLGHRVVAEVAESYLSSKARKQIKMIMGDESITMSSNWMDFIKSNSSFNYTGSWHYVNLPAGLTYEQAKAALAKDTSANAYNKILFVSAELKKKTVSKELKQFYIRVLVHMVGDLHQPLHCGRVEDKGGNDVDVKWFNHPDNLHSIWDSNLPEYQQLSYSEYTRFINHPNPTQLKEWQHDDLTTWVFESYQISEKLYKEAETNTSYGYKYNYEWVDTMNNQLLKGGIRLASLLNGIFAHN
ncbi:putative S1/P1 Nuclease [Arcticibacter svalbardensis MN12-7]|uniref:Putative S1/P1 Nuclease n=1 Tax=Arcticibacter svalbardensis MN12-7 TaxID=1150600 RepID=R9GRP5_9SPHI|nr:S1/P1 nuclease [Arcticibacter svalbardensis]EOR94396.1 putative S1/P1 Nuclease [Arcticibacter svalbardensis MN12-7]